MDLLVEILVFLHALFDGVNGIHDRAVVHVIERSPDITEGNRREFTGQVHGHLAREQNTLLP